MIETTKDIQTIDNPCQLIFLEAGSEIEPQLALALQDRQALQFCAVNIFDSYKKMTADEQTRIRVVGAFRTVMDNESDMQKAYQAFITLSTETRRHFNTEARREYKKSKAEQQCHVIAKHIPFPTNSMLDYGCGNMVFAAEMQTLLFQIQGVTPMAVGVDVLQYADTEVLHRAQRDDHLSFIHNPKKQPLNSMFDSPFDLVTALNVLHHIPTADIRSVLLDLRKIAQRVVLIEDVILPSTHAGEGTIPQIPSNNALLKWYRGLPIHTQHNILAIMDVWGNGIGEMGQAKKGMSSELYPFSYHTPSEWRRLFAEANFSLVNTELLGFREGRMHRPCECLFVFE